MSEIEWRDWQNILNGTLICSSNLLFSYCQGSHSSFHSPVTRAMKRSHTQSDTKHTNINEFDQKSKFIPKNRRELPCVDIDKVLAKYDKDSNNEEAQNQSQKSKLEILASQIFSQKFQHEKFSSKNPRSNYRTYYSREDSKISSGSFLGFSMKVKNSENMVKKFNSMFPIQSLTKFKNYSFSNKHWDNEYCQLIFCNSFLS